MRGALRARAAVMPVETRPGRVEWYWLPRQNDFRNFLMSPESAEVAQMVANLA